MPNPSQIVGCHAFKKSAGNHKKFVSGGDPQTRNSQIPARILFGVNVFG